MSRIAVVDCIDSSGELLSVIGKWLGRAESGHAV